MYQAKATDVNLGLLAAYRLKDSESEILAGLSVRTRDAVILHVGLRQKQNVYRISYDINTSYLNQFTGGKGALEISVNYFGGY